jgi:hypothetical protein
LIMRLGVERGSLAHYVRLGRSEILSPIERLTRLVFATKLR